MVIAQYPPLIGGAEMQAQRLATALAAEGVEVEVITGWFRGASLFEQSHGVAVRRLPAPGFGSDALKMLSLTTAVFLAVLVRFNRFDVLHIHLASSLAYAGVKAARLLRRPSIVKIANTGPRFDLNRLARGFPFRLGQLMAQYIADKATRFAVLNPQIMGELLQWGVPARRMVNIPNGVPIYEPASSAKQTKYRQQLCLPLEGPLLICVGSFHTKKKQAVLLHALRRLSERMVKAYLILLGDGPQRKVLEQQVMADGLKDQVIFRGQVANVLDYLYASDVFVLPSLVEGLSNALLEAMSVGLPCIVSDIAGNRAVVEDGATGLVCTSNDSAALTEALARVLEDKRLAALLGANARKLVREDYSIQSVARRYRSLYNSLIESQHDELRSIGASSSIDT